MSDIICMWSGPRNLSTAMMRSFGSRSDFAVMDEPFFAPFLAVSDKDHPGRAETLKRHETDPEKVAQLCQADGPNGEAYVFQKHMPHHMLDEFPLEWAKQARHFFLIREPARVIASYVKGREAFDLDDLGFAPQIRMYDTLSDMTEQVIPIVDSFDILSDPPGILAKLCTALEIPFDPAMLSWPAGPQPEDGAWAPYWYHSVERSTGFQKPPTRTVDIGPEFNEMLAECEADYAKLRARRIRV